MEVVAATPNGGGVPPFHDHDVREWSRIDSLTGVLERARLETDHWTANTNNSCHKYGKVVDSRARTDADGAVQQKARRQLEVYHSQIPGGHLQVIKTHTVSSSRWTNKGTAAAIGAAHDVSKDFEDLQLTLNPLDLTSQKSKASVGRGVGRRPPSRPRARDEPQLDNPLRNAHQTAAVNLYRVSRLCHQIHDNTVRQTFGKYLPATATTKSSPPNERQNGDGVEIIEIESVSSSNDNERTRSLNGHQALSRAKSSSSEDLHLSSDKDKSTKSTEDLEDLEQLQSWRRTSKLRRSLQYPKQTTNGTTTTTTTRPHDLPENSGSVRKIREELEKGRRLSTALRGNNVDLEALDQILQSISSSSSTSDKTSTIEDADLDDNLGKQQKRNSFVTVETLQEVRGRLRRTSSPGFDSPSKPNKDEEIDDGIVTEDSGLKETTTTTNPKSRVRSYVYGMEAMLNKKPIVGTGSLESRAKLNGGTNIRNDDWYNRRKSYGFEQVHNHNDSSNPISLKTKNRMESSTDSGICRSSEIVIIPTKKDLDSDKISTVKQMSSIFDQPRKDNDEFPYRSTTITIPIISSTTSSPNSMDLSDRDKRHSIAVDESKYVTSNNENRFRRTSLVEEDATSQNRKLKKVEFCKTEVHFAAESGRVNIVETDEKPPPTNNFRRRRRNSGPLVDEYERNGLPVLHFGDSSYEKSLLGVNDDDSTKHDPDDIYQNVPKACGTVTVNTRYDQIDLYDDQQRDGADSDNIKGILKNKPVKPTPYHLGEELSFINHSQSSDSDSGKWGIRLKPVNKTDPLFWKSTVTLHNTVYSKENDNDGQPEFQKLLKNLRPTTKPDLLSANCSGIKFVTSSSDTRQSWSVADKIKLGDDNHWTENKLYSTKVNFGDGGTTVVENDSFKEADLGSKWISKDSPVKDSKPIVNKGLIVRIGREDYSAQSRTSEANNATTTTTKITIDLSPSPTNSNLIKSSPLPPNRTKNQRSHSFKSTSLILDTIRNEHNNNKIPQLEALRKLYEDIQSDSDADKEVQVLMENMNGGTERDDDTSSVVSGSWSKMGAYKMISEHFNKTISDQRILSPKLNAKVEKDSSNKNIRSTGAFGVGTTSPSPTETKPTPARNAKLSPAAVRKAAPSVKRPDLMTAPASHKLSSPSLVGKNCKLKSQYESKAEQDYVNVNDTKLQQKFAKSDIVLRQPKKSEMTYFGINLSPKPAKKIQQSVIAKDKNKHFDKPDLLQHMKTDSKPRRNSPENATKRKESPIYENINSVSRSKDRYGREFDATILEELTKAADQILQAVNGFTDDDSQNRLSDDAKKEPLETISETKSWSQERKIRTTTTTTTTTKPTTCRAKLKHTSSTSSIESLTRDVKKPIAPVRQTTKTAQERLKKKTTSSDSGSTKATIKARRLQRASSREALLHSHGSSSEDLGINVEVPQRKPRQIRKTKVAQLSVTNGLEIKKAPPNPPRRKTANEDGKTKPEDKTVDAMPEIRHKTAVSTIRSTAEKYSRDRSKTRIEDATKRKLVHQKRESSRGVQNCSRSTDSKRTASSRDTVNHRISTATHWPLGQIDSYMSNMSAIWHNLSTVVDKKSTVQEFNIKKCSRADGGTKH